MVKTDTSIVKWIILFWIVGILLLQVMPAHAAPKQLTESQEYARLTSLYIAMLAEDSQSRAVENKDTSAIKGLYTVAVAKYNLTKVAWTLYQQAASLELSTAAKFKKRFVDALELAERSNYDLQAARGRLP